MLAVILMSGGMDSALIAQQAIDLGYELAALHLNYGQLTQVREQKAYEDLCNHFNIERRLIVDVTHLALIGGSSLTDKRIHVTAAKLENEEIPNSYVPFRNANILAIATSWAEVIGAEALFIGAMQQDSSGYPDCRREFFDAFEKTIHFGTKPETNIKIITPIIDYQKSDVVKEGLLKNVPFELTWSCYKNDEVACGTCDSCALRLRGFSLAGAEDKIPYVEKQNF